MRDEELDILLTVLLHCCRWIRKHSPADDWPFIVDEAELLIKKYRGGLTW